MNTYTALIVCSALVAALNPCTLSVLIMSITSLTGKGKHAKHVGAHTATFSLGIFTAQALFGTALLLLLSIFPVGIVGYFALILACVVSIFGLFEVKDYFWYGKGWSFALSAKADKKIHAWTKKHHSPLRGYLLGIYTSYKLTHYTAILVLLNVVIASLLAPGNIWVPAIWALWYVMPLLFISVLTLSGVRAHSFLAWKEQSKHTMRLSMGLLYILIGWIVLVVLTGGLKLV